MRKWRSQDWARIESVQRENVKFWHPDKTATQGFNGAPFIAPRGSSRVHPRLAKMGGSRHDALPSLFSNGTSAQEAVAKIWPVKSSEHDRSCVALLDPQQLSGGRSDFVMGPRNELDGAASAVLYGHAQ